MERYIITAILLYAVVVACYLLWERRVKHRLNAARKKGYNPFKPSPKEDIIGKSHFILRHSKPEATTLEISDKFIRNSSTFADDNGQNPKQDTSGDDPATESEKEDTPIRETEDSGEEIDIVIEDEPEGEYEAEDEDDGIDYDESEEAEYENSGGGIARGLVFEELSGTVRTVDHIDRATDEEKEKAGRVLVEVRETRLLRQIADDEPKQKVVSDLMDGYFTAYYRRQGERNPDAAVKAPADFNARGFV